MRNSHPNRPKSRRVAPRLPAPILYAGLLLTSALAAIALITLGNGTGDSRGMLSSAEASTAIETGRVEHIFAYIGGGTAPEDAVDGEVTDGSVNDEERDNESLAILAASQDESQAASPVESQDEPQAASDDSAHVQASEEIALAEEETETQEPAPDQDAPAEEAPAAPVLVSTATPTSIAEPSPAPTPTDTPAALPERVALTGIRHMWQTWNNCGPATLAMNLSYYGSPLGQAEIGAAIRTHPDDKNVNAEELAEYARQQGFAAQARVNGDGELVRRLISQGIPVLIETWLEPDDGFGHYRLLTGYDDPNQRWIAHDSYVGDNLVNSDPNNYAGIYLPYDETDQLWAVYNRTYILIYPHEQAAIVEEILGAATNPDVMWQEALTRAQETLAAQQAEGRVTPFAWFNLGGSLYHLGRAPEAAAAFDEARAIGLPWRMLWYQFEPFAAYYEVGRYQDVVDLARATLATTRDLEEVQYWYGMGLAALGDTQGARQAWEYVLELKPGYTEAREALEGIGNS